MPTGVYRTHFLPETFKNVEFRVQTARKAENLCVTRVRTGKPLRNDVKGFA